MNTFIQEFKKSFSNRGWYIDIAEDRVKFRFTYVLTMALSISIFISLYIAYFLYGQFIPQSRGLLLESIPADLVVTFKSGELFINKPVPYKLPLTQGSVKTSGKAPTNLLVIDTAAEANFDSNEKYDTAIFANKYSMVTRKDNGEIRAFNFKSIPDNTLTRDTAISLFNTVAKFAWILAIIILVPITAFLLGQMLLTFLLAGCLLWLGLKIAGKNILFRNAITASMYAYTIIFSASIVLNILGLPSFRFLSSAVLTAVIAFIFILISKKPEIIEQNKPQNPTIA